MLMESSEQDLTEVPGASRVAAVADLYMDKELATRRLSELLALALRGLTLMYEPGSGTFPQTMRGKRSADGPRLEPEGTSLRYSAMVALGLSRVSLPEQRSVLAGSTAADLARSLARGAQKGEAGAAALAAWALAEVAGEYDAGLFDSITALVRGKAPVATVVWAWCLTAAIAASHLVDTNQLTKDLVDRLLASQGPRGLFPHVLPRDTQPRFRAHVGCYADQIYPVQALARYSALTGSTEALEAANLCASRLCATQGTTGQWWWHYDVRDGSVLERFPVYSVHQHAMGPMALLELQEAGGRDHRYEVFRGVRWLYTHPEVMDDLIASPLSVVWRKVGRREPHKASRLAAAVTTSMRPGLHLPGVDVLLPPTQIDYECRPYELGWLLYAWRGDGAVARLRGHRHD